MACRIGHRPYSVGLIFGWPSRAAIRSTATVARTLFGHSPVFHATKVIPGNHHSKRSLRLKPMNHAHAPQRQTARTAVAPASIDLATTEEPHGESHRHEGIAKTPLTCQTIWMLVLEWHFQSRQAIDLGARLDATNQAWSNGNTNQRLALGCIARADMAGNAQVADWAKWRTRCRVQFTIEYKKAAHRRW